jgi:hypothetical protein
MFFEAVISSLNPFRSAVHFGDATALIHSMIKNNESRI